MVEVATVGEVVHTVEVDVVEYVVVSGPRGLILEQALSFSCTMETANAVYCDPA